MYEYRLWVIVNVDDITDEMIEKAIQTSRDTLCKSLDESKAILKWDGDTPSCFDGMVMYTQRQIMEELCKSDWYEEE